MQIRRWRITSESGKLIEFTVRPAPPDLVSVSKCEIDMELKTRKYLNELIAKATEFMSGNTISKVEIEEEEV